MMTKHLFGIYDAIVGDEKADIVAFKLRKCIHLLKVEYGVCEKYELLEWFCNIIEAISYVLDQND